MMDLRSAGSIRAEHRQHDRNGLSCGLSGEPGGERDAGFALMKNEHRPCALTNDEVTLPMAALGSAVDSLGPFVDGDAILDGILRRSRPAWPAAFVTTREITPRKLRDDLRLHLSGSPKGRAPRPARWIPLQMGPIVWRGFFLLVSVREPTICSTGR